MKLLLLLPLLLIISCQEGIGSRSLVNDSAIEKPENNSPDTPVVPAASTLNTRCQSALRCFFSRAPNYSQNDSGLENYIGNRIGVSNYSDPGLCSPTAATIALKSVLEERDSRTRLNNSFLQSIPSLNWHEILYQIGIDSHTDFREGGTYAFDVYIAFQKYFKNTVSHKGLYLTMNHSWSQSVKLSNQDIINLIKAKKPAFYTSLNALTRKEAFIQGKSKVWYEHNASGHALVIKGFDGDRLLVQDPWGMDYFTRLEHQNFANDAYGSARVNGVFTDLTNSSDNFIGYFGSSQKVVIDQVITLGLD